MGYSGRAKKAYEEGRKAAKAGLSRARQDKHMLQIAGAALAAGAGVGAWDGHRVSNGDPLGVQIFGLELSAADAAALGGFALYAKGAGATRRYGLGVAVGAGAVTLRDRIYRHMVSADQAGA